MNNRVAILGTSVAGLLTLCIIGVVLIGAIGQLFLKSPETPESVRIAQVAAIQTPIIAPTMVKSSPIRAAAILERPVDPANEPVSSGPTVTGTPPPTLPPTLTPSPTPSLTPTPTPIVAYPGMATRLVIPKIDLDSPIVLAPVVNGSWAVDHLDQMIGHLEGTAPPGSDSNIVLAGHVTLSAGVLGPFASLSLLAPGDVVIVYEGGKEHLYQIDDRQTVSRTNVEVVYPTETGKVTLITCINWNSQEGRYNNRLVVTGRLINN